MRIQLVKLLAVSCCFVFFSCITINTIVRQHFESLKSKKEIVVVIFGDSISGGGGISQTGTSYGTFLKAMLEKLFQCHVSLINSSRQDESYRIAHRRIQEDILSYRPDIVFVMLGFVDAFLPGILPTTHLDNINKFLSELKKSGVFVIVLTTTGLRDVETKNDMRVQILENYNNVVRDCTRYYHYPLIDIARHMDNLRLSKPREYLSMFGDYILLNDKGKEYVADYIYHRITTILGDQF